jgi:hypothetical protein
LLRFRLGSADESLETVSRWAGSRDKEVKKMKARLYRMAFVAGIVAILLEGLGAGWKWG